MDKHCVRLICGNNMSLFDCLAILKERANALPLNNTEQVFIEKLIKDFKSIINDDSFEKLEHYPDIIKDYRKTRKGCDYLEVIQKEVENVWEKFKGLSSRLDVEKSLESNFSLTDAAINARKILYRQFDIYKIAHIAQGQDYRLGGSRGECLGFTYSMVYPESPYKEGKGKVDRIGFNKTVYKHQKNQSNRTKDQGKVKNIRITREYFSENFRKQAEKAHSIAQKHIDSEFSFSRRSLSNAHATYFSVRSNGEIWYMEPNFGAYIFPNKEVFIDYYDLISKIYTNNGFFGFVFQLTKLRYDPEKKLKESRTWSGIIRSILTGSKYPQVSNLSLFFYVCSALLVGAGIGVTIGSFIPGLGLAVGMLIGGAIGVITVGSIYLVASIIGMNGILWPIHSIKAWRAEKRLKREMEQVNDETVKATSVKQCEVNPALSQLNPIKKYKHVVIQDSGDPRFFETLFHCKPPENPDSQKHSKSERHLNTDENTP